jgi:membrane protease YdiL (CAAX protease family)
MNMITLSGLLRLLPGLIIAAFMLYFPYIWCKRRKESEEAYGLRWFMGPGAWRDTVTATLATLVPLTFVSFYWPSAWGAGGPFRPGALTALNLLGGGVAASFIEETFYRGWMQTLCIRKLGAWIAIPLVSLLFALSHLFVAPSWLRVATFFPGLVMGLLRHRGGSVLPAIIYHAVCNVWAVWWMPR